MKKFLKKAGLAVLRLVLGMNVVDQRTGKVVARVVVLRWKGGLRLIGLEGLALRPHFLTQERERYWAQDLGFSTHDPPDFPSVGSPPVPVASPDESQVRSMAGPGGRLTES